MPPMMTKKELATYLKVSTKTIDLFRKLGLIHCVKVRNTVRFTTPAIRSFLRLHLVETTE